MWAEPLWNAASVLLGYSIFCAVIWRRARRSSAPPFLSDPNGDGVLVSYASQGGTAERIARQSAHRLHGKVQVAVLPMNQVNADTLRQYKQALTWFMGKTATCTLPDRKSTRLNSSHVAISYAVFCLKKK